MVHIPEAPHEPPFPALVMLHGFTGNKIESHRLFVKAARRFASEGILTLRFDFRGCGESEGDFEEVRIEGEIGDALASLAFVRGRADVRAENVGLLGFSFGGAIAACAAAISEEAPRCLVLWAAVADLKRAFDTGATESIAAGLGTRAIHDFHGYALSQDLLDELHAFRPAERARSYLGPVLICHGGADRSVSPDDAIEYREAFSENGAPELHIVEGAGHTFAGLGWEAELLNVTSRFLVPRLGGR